jgi:hypothetical protein
VRLPKSASPDGAWILTTGLAQPGVFFLNSPDFKNERRLTSTRLRQAPVFSKDGRDLIGLSQNTSGDGAPWQLWAIEIATGRERWLADVDLPVAIESVIGFSMHPDGTRFLTSGGSSNLDIWMLKGFDRQ